MRCGFLDAPSHHCRVYVNRPFECQLYPFVMSREDGRVKVYAHLGCPFLAEHKDSPALRSALSRARIFFQKQGLDWTRANSAVLADYRVFSDELVYLFDVAFADNGEAFFKQRPLIDAALAARSGRLSARSFVSMFLWKEHFTFEAEEAGGNMLVFARNPVGTFLYLPPLGRTIVPAAVHAAFERMRVENGASGVSRIENVPAEELSSFNAGCFDIREQTGEYIYRRRDIAALAGQAYKSQRHEVNLFERAHAGHSVEYRAFAMSDRQGCQELFDRWLDARRAAYEDTLYRALLEDSRGVHALVFEEAPRLGMTGRVVVIDGRIAAYTFGYSLGDGVFCVAFEVADPAVKGLAAFIFRAFCADEALEDFGLINTMDDFGMPQVAAAKKAWNPVCRQAVYGVTERRSHDARAGH
jgi:hypothetical protein